MQKVVLRQVLQFEGQLAQLEPERMYPDAQTVHEVELVQFRQLLGHEGQLLPVK